MNIETGKIYTDPEEIRKAIERGEPLEPMTKRPAGPQRVYSSNPAMDAKMRTMNRRDRRKFLAERRREKKRVAEDESQSGTTVLVRPFSGSAFCSGSARRRTSAGTRRPGQTRSACATSSS